MKLGTKVATRSIVFKTDMDDKFAKGVAESMKRFQNKDFGDLSDEDKQSNMEALENGGMIMGSYNIGSDRIWIMRDADGKGSYVTTVLFPDEY